jgi:nucleoside-diphosphate-sugar epimerase
MSRLIVVGKHGYIASALCRWFDQRRIPYTAISSSECDLEQVEAVARRFQEPGSEETQVVFTAAINPWLDNSASSYDKNLRMVSNFVAAMGAVNLKHVLYLSTVDVYGTAPPLPVSERSPPRPDSWYGRAKYECEQRVQHCNSFGAAVTILRLPGIYGPGDNDRSVVGKLVRDIRDKNEVTLHANGGARRDYVSINDLCAIVAHLLAKRSQGTWNVATGTSLPIRQIASIIGDILGIAFRVVEGPSKEERYFDLVFDNSLLRSAIPGLKCTSLRRGILAYGGTRAEETAAVGSTSQVSGAT